jgi:hypothetical protein
LENVIQQVMEVSSACASEPEVKGE